MASPDLTDAWDAAVHRYSGMDNLTARFNVGLLNALRSRWAESLRPDTSMFTLLFTRPGMVGYDAGERVEVLLEAEDRVQMRLVRQSPRRGETRPTGPVTVTGDHTKPENALPAVEALLSQLADPGD